MSVQHILTAGLRAAEARMGAVNGGSDCIVRLRGAATAQDEATGRKGYAWSILWSGPMRLAGVTRGASTERAEEPAHVQVSTAARTAHLPRSATALAGIEDGAFIEITAGACTGTVWRVVEATDHDQATARRLPVEQVDRPEGWPTS